MMPVLGVALGRLKALALAVETCSTMMIDIAQLLQRIDQRLDIVTGVQVAIVEPQRAENVALAGAVAGAQLGQIAIQTTVVFGNGLVVIVDDNDQVAVEIGGIVKALKRQTARKRAVANNGNDVIRVTRQVARVGKTAAQAHRGRGVTHGKQVMLGLVGIGKARGLAITLRIDIGVRAPGQRFVCVGLVRHVKDNFVGGGVKHAVERDRELNDARLGATCPPTAAELSRMAWRISSQSCGSSARLRALTSSGVVVCVSSIVVGYSMRIERRRSLGRHNCTKQSRTFWRLICDGGAVIRQLAGQSVLSDAILMCSMMFLSIVHRPWIVAASRWKEAACPMPFVPRKSRAKWTMPPVNWHSRAVWT